MVSTKYGSWNGKIRVNITLGRGGYTDSGSKKERHGTDIERTTEGRVRFEQETGSRKPG